MKVKMIRIVSYHGADYDRFACNRCRAEVISTAMNFCWMCGKQFERDSEGGKVLEPLASDLVVVEV